MNLILSFVALALGPLLWVACQKSEPARGFLESFLFVTIAGIVFVHIVPETFKVAGFSAAVFLILGIFFAFAIERLATMPGGNRYSWVLVIATLGLVVHAMIDGLALLPESSQSGEFEALLNNHIALGVIMHRIAVSMAIWWILRPQMGTTVAVAALVLIGVATSTAYFVGEPILELLMTNSIAWFQAFVAGSLLHIIVLYIPNQAGKSHGEMLSINLIGGRLGIIAGLLLILLLPGSH
ncbi:MAG: hypothetical protein QNJ73_10105 [Gammaproteobacteria bacterium]|nr:hypothetical protein [Gammaproteobacteria bacterium]